MNKVLVIAPHPDDETLGCGGTLLRHSTKGDEIYWLIVTGIDEAHGWSAEQVRMRDEEIKKVSAAYGFCRTCNLTIPTTRLDTIPMTDLIEKIGSFIKSIEPEILYMPYVNDVHTDHQIIAKALQPTFKWFRYPYIRKVLMYETPSETEFNFIEKITFNPNVFVNITNHLDDKIEAMEIYESEMCDFPFPRSDKTMRSLAAFRGSQCGYEAAEAFQLVYERK